MNQNWSPFDPDTALGLAPSPGSLEMPSLHFQPGERNERADVLGSAPRFASSSFQPATDAERLPSLADEVEQALQPDPETERRLKSLRSSPGFALIADSVLLLKVYQLDMDLPPRRRHFLRERLSTLLEQHAGRALDPDQVYLTFETDSHPSVDDDGTEHYTRRLSLTYVAQARFDMRQFHGLSQATLLDVPVCDAAPSLRAATLFKLVSEASWVDDYSLAHDRFWARQRATYRTLCKLGFVDGLARQHARKRISREGYLLTLDALGLRVFPETVADVERSGSGRNSEVWGLCVAGEYIPGIFQIRSKNTSHCFIHVIGAQRHAVEYISDDPAEMTRRLVAALNDSGWHRQLLDVLELPDRNAAVVRAARIDGDLFSALTRAQEDLTSDLLSAEELDRFDLLKPVARALALASAVELWQPRSSVLDLIPEASNTAAQLMRDFLAKRYGLTHNPDQVFIAYRRGHATTPLGDARKPATHVHVPDETPLSLSRALIEHYQVQYPAGYIDHGGRTVVFLDTSGKGEWNADQALPIEPQAIEEHIRDLDFLGYLCGQITDFWDLHKHAAERALVAAFITQAVISLKRGHLTRRSFDLVIEALDQPQAGDWQALGFHVQGSALDPMTAQYPGLLVLERPGTAKVLYQAGHTQAFRDFPDTAGLHQHLRRVAADQDWRESRMHYIPARYHERLDYLLKLWGGIQMPHPPASMLAPWTDVLRNPDTRKALHHTLIELRLDGSPFEFMRERLKRSALADAQDQITTATEVSLRYWTSRLHQLQYLLVPMSLLLTPAFLASLAAELGLASLTLAAAHLPGGRHEEKKHALLSALSLGLLRLGPQTPRLLRSLGRIMKPGGQGARAGVSQLAHVRCLPSFLRRSMTPRQTRLAKFFHTDAVLKRWTVASHPQFGTLSVHAWKLGHRFLLWTSERGQARTLVVSSHGHYMPWTSTVKIPHGSEIHTYAPHGYILVDPKLHRIVNRTVQPFAISNAAGNTLVQSPAALPSLLQTDKVMAGTALPGRLKNYTLSKFQSLRQESYEDIAHIVRNSNASPLAGQLPATPMDVLTIRNRFGMPSPTLADLFNTLYAQGIHYDKILLVHCRCAAMATLLNRVPIYQAPTLKPSITRASDTTASMPETPPDDLTHRL